MPSTVTKTSTGELCSTRDAGLVLFGSTDLWASRRVRRMCDAGTLHHIRIGERGDRFIPRAVLDAFLASASTD